MDGVLSAICLDGRSGRGDLGAHGRDLVCDVARLILMDGVLSAIRFDGRSAVSNSY